MKTGKQYIGPVYQATIILLLTFIAYSPVLNNGFTNWDDPLYVTENPLIRTFNFHHFQLWFTQPFQGLYQPLILASLAIDYSFHGLNPYYFHLTNLILHLANTLLVFIFIRKLFKNRISALLVALLFGLHPIHVESVAWITERKDVLYTFFFLIALIFYLNFRQSEKRKYYALTMLFFILALISKVSAVVLPLLLILIDYYHGRKLFGRKVIIEKIPLLILALLFGLGNIYFHRDFGSLANYSNLSIPMRLLLASKGLMYYLYKTIWPNTLAVYNPLPLSISTAIIVECLIHFLVYVTAIILLLKLKSRTLIFGALFFLAAILFFLIPPGEPVLASERYAYVSSIGLFVIIAYLMNKMRQLPKNSAGQFLIYTVFSIWLGFLGLKTHNQAKVWKSSFSLWDHVIEVRGESFLALLQRGNIYTEVGEYEKAINDYSRSIEIHPAYYKTYDQFGHVQLLRGNYDASIKAYTKSLELNPDGEYAHLSLGFTYRQTGDLELAMNHLNKALRLNPVNPEIYYNRGKIYLEQGQNENACADFRNALKIGLTGKNQLETLDFVNSLCK